MARPPLAAVSESLGVDLAFGDGSTRFFVPAGVTRAARAPLAVVLHGLGGDGREIVEGLGLETFARARGLILAAPDGKLDPQGRRFWNAGEVCCNFSREPVDDVSRLSRLIESAVRELNADPARVFVIGYSNGGFMAHRLACSKAAPPIRAIVSLAAAGPAEGEACDAARPLHVLEIHGDRDAIVPFDGGHLFGRDDLPLVPAVKLGLARWARVAGCSGELAPDGRLDLLPSLPGEETEVRRYRDCSRSLTLWRVEGGAHVLGLGPLALEAIWAFLESSSAVAQ